VFVLKRNFDGVPDLFDLEHIVAPFVLAVFTNRSINGQGEGFVLF
jgi:hypothetical protein